MKITTKQKTAIRAHYAHLRLRFKTDGTVEAQKGEGRAWGILYTPERTAAHLKALDDLTALAFFARRLPAVRAAAKKKPAI
jgi:hypothetical protein